MSSLQPEPKARAFIGLGGNLGNPREAMRAALKALDGEPSTDVVRVSSLYRTPPWGRTDQPDFLNAVAELRTELPPRGLLSLCLSAEASLRRVRGERWGPRSIDLDILLYDALEIDEEGLRVPHPRMLERAFVLAPLAEIAPDLTIRERTVAEHLAGVDSGGIVIEAGGDWWR